MSDSAFVSLIYNAALLLVLVFLYDLIARYLRQQSLAFKLLTGLVLGVDLDRGDARGLAPLRAASSSTRAPWCSAWGRSSTARCRA